MSDDDEISTPLEQFRERMRNNDGWEFAGTVGVDGAHVMIVDPCYAQREATDFHTDNHLKASSVVKRDDSLVSRGHMSVTAVSGAGDGRYRVFIKRGVGKIKYDDWQGERITHMMIDFTENAYGE